MNKTTGTSSRGLAAAASTEATAAKPKRRPVTTEADWFRFMLDHNLDYVIVFHNYVQALLKKELGKEPARSTMIHIYDKMNSGNVLLLSLAYVEEMFYLCWRRQFPKRPIPAGSSISRYKPLIQALGLDVGKMRSWTTLSDAYQVRHCLLHAHGRVSLMRHPSAIRRCIKRYEGGLEEQLDRVVVTSRFLQRSLVAIRELRTAMLRHLEV